MVKWLTQLFRGGSQEQTIKVDGVSLSFSHKQLQTHRALLESANEACALLLSEQEWLTAQITAVEKQFDGVRNHSLGRDKSALDSLKHATITFDEEWWERGHTVVEKFLKASDLREEIKKMIGEFSKYKFGENEIKKFSNVENRLCFRMNAMRMAMNRRKIVSQLVSKYLSSTTSAEDNHFLG
jgi:hypothetical protein